MKAGGVIGQSGSCSTNGSSALASPSHVVPRSTGGHARLAQRPGRRGDEGLAVDQRVRQGSAVVVEHGTEGGWELHVVVHTPTLEVAPDAAKPPDEPGASLVFS